MIKEIVSTAYESLLNILAPPLCPSCNTFLETQTYICDTCVRTIRPLVPLEIPITQTKSTTIYVIGAYEKILRTLILKKNNRHAIATSAMLGHFLWHYSLIKHIPFDLIVPIPLHWTRQVWRGFNQAEEMAQSIARQSNKQIISALKRKKKTKFQAECSKEERGENIKEAFSLTIDPSLIGGKIVLIVDDLVTTGTTIKAASALLYAAKAEKVIVAAVCRT